MSRFHEPDLSVSPDSPFVRDASNKLVRRSYWMDAGAPTASADDDATISAAISVGYYKTSNRGTYATTP